MVRLEPADGKVWDEGEWTPYTSRGVIAVLDRAECEPFRWRGADAVQDVMCNGIIKRDTSEVELMTKIHGTI